MNKQTPKDIAKQRTSELIVGLASKINTSALTAANVNTEVDTAINTAVPEPPTANSLADTLHKDGSYTYDNTTDSLEAVSDKITALNDVSTAEVNAEVDTALSDYDPPTKTEMDSGFAALNDVSTAEVNTEVDTALNTALPQPPTTNSLADILHKDGSYTYDNTTDSLEAIRDAIIGGSGCAYNTAVPEPPTANSLADILHKDGSYTYDNTTDSLEVISEYVRFKKAATITTTTSATYVSIVIQNTVGELIAVSIESRSAAADRVFCTINIDGAGALSVGCNDAAQDTSYWVRHGTTREAGIGGNYYEIETGYHDLHIKFNTSLVIQMRDPVAATGGAAVIYAIYNIKT